VRVPDKKDLIKILVTGYTGISVYNIALNYGELSITAGEACFIVNTVPIFTALFAYFFLDEPIAPKFIFGLLLSFLGVFLIALGFAEGLSLRSGSLFILLAAIAQAVFFILQKPLLQKYKPIEVTSYAIWAGSVLMLPFGFSFLQKVSSASFQATASVIYLGVFPAAVAYLCWSAVLSKIPASKTSTFLYLAPVIAIVIGFVWLDKLPPSLISVVGGILAIGGVIFVNLKRTEAEKGPIS
jgi:drug/metabolite transporter (DMT)-like permease